MGIPLKGGYMGHNRGKIGRRRAGALKEILDAEASAHRWTKKRRVIRQRDRRETHETTE
jgi:hypothetical protein